MANAEQGKPVVWTPLPAAARMAAAERIGSVLLETARFDHENCQSYLFLDPLEILIARELDDIPHIFAQIESALARGMHVAGYFAYECGYHFEPSTGLGFKPDGEPLIWLGVYEQPRVFDHISGSFAVSGSLAGESLPGLASTQSQQESPREAHVYLASIALDLTPEEYCARIREVQQYIATGDTYQVNFTSRVSFLTQRPVLETFAALSDQQPVSFSAFLNLGETQLLSLSPELFFRVEAGKITTRPMKGTMPRGLDAGEDAQAAERLRKDEKNRAEHVMIVDLLRNDLGRICAMGTVAVEELFTVERYETLLQMTSTISGMLQPGLSYYEVFRALFPSGSITGAPKVRTMQIIRGLETQPRGAYTGAIGYISPDRSSAFNVAIRTLVKRGDQAWLGVGGGIVADSDPMAEYRECLLKGSFLTRTRQNFQLIETMLWEREIRLLPLHLQRLEASASYFSFSFDRTAIEEHLQTLAASLNPGPRYRIRLLLDRSGEVRVTAEVFRNELPKGRVLLSADRTSSTDVFFHHKTTHRNFYDRHYAQAREAGFDDVLFLNERGELTEGAISNVFVQRESRLLTPPLGCGVLDGVYRRHLLGTRAHAEERVLTLADLQSAEAVFLCNALRGIYEVNVVHPA